MGFDNEFEFYQGGYLLHMYGHGQQICNKTPGERGCFVKTF